ncbi:8-hydroxygeraniol dehydrogenase-like [Carica papaya]|uniref:8-hydroxygeraniol dehydrogenase-like n=1 Tax=Carica papaya TaxID=3649 RepID=UPI000B8C89B8|nr:8-hydroxygeraniol dehydrogenase-like [Carica papaya]
MAERSPETVYPIKAYGWAARDSSGHLSPFNFSRRGTGEEDVRVKVLYCGICDGDLCITKNIWETAVYPMVPGHEIVGEVTEVGNKVKKVKIGDKVGVGCIVGACHSCENCVNDLENYCPEMIFTYNSIHLDGKITYGGFSDHVVVNEHYILRIPNNVPLDSLPPLLCAGITVYSPLKYFGLGKVGKHVGIVGLGGLGHLAVKFAKAMGAQVTVISTSPSKKTEALERLGADAFLVSHDTDQLEFAAKTMDGVIDTVSAAHSLEPYFSLLKFRGRLVLLGAPATPLEIHPYSLYDGRKEIVGSYIGGIKETEEMIDFAAKHNIKANVEIVPIDYVNMAMERVAKSDVKYRFVIDVGNTLPVTKP